MRDQIGDGRRGGRAPGVVPRVPGARTGSAAQLGCAGGDASAGDALGVGAGGGGDRDGDWGVEDAGGSEASGDYGSAWRRPTTADAGTGFTASCGAQEEA